MSNAQVLPRASEQCLLGRSSSGLNLYALVLTGSLAFLPAVCAARSSLHSCVGYEVMYVGFDLLCMYAEMSCLVMLCTFVQPGCTSVGHLMCLLSF